MLQRGKAKQVHEVVGNVRIVEVPITVEVPEFIKVEKPEYVLVKEEITYTVPRIKYEDKTYERPVLKEKEYIIPKYVEKVYEIPIYVEKIYEIPKYVQKIIEVPKIKIIEKEEVKVIEVPFEVKVPKYIEEDKHITNAIITDKHVTNAIIEHVTIEALHPRYICRKCAKEEVDPVRGENQ